MSNIEYYGMQSLDTHEIKHFKNVQKRRAKRLADRYDKNKAVIAEIEAFERQEQAEAFAAYQKMRAERKYRDDLNMLKNIHNIFLPG